MRWFYDLESYTNLFSACFLSDEPQPRREQFITGCGHDDREALVDFLVGDSVTELVGFNSYYYDDLLLAYLVNYKDSKITANILNSLSRLIIKRDLTPKQRKKINSLKYRDNEWQSVDLLQVVGGSRSGASLKMCAVHLGHNRLQDLPIPWDATIKDSDVDTIIEYNWNDVEITGKLYHAIESAITMRREIGNEYKSNLLCASESAIGNVIFNTLHGKPEIQETPRERIDGIDLIPSKIKFDTSEMQNLQNRIEQLELNPGRNDRYNFQEKYQYAGIDYILGVGGLHSVDAPGQWFSDVNQIVRDADVGSYYPALIINEKLTPEHLDQRWLDLYTRIRDERIAAKKSGNAVKANGLKIALNGTFGKLNSKYFWLYDPLQFLRVTIGGQLYLLDLIEKLELAGIHTISANTDGVICAFPAEMEETYNRVCAEWVERTGLVLDYTDYQQYTRLNVNSYLAVDTDKKVKRKKDFALNKPDNVWTFGKGYNAPIIAIALSEYFINGRDPLEYVKTIDDIRPFLIARKNARTELYSIQNNVKTKLQKTNRFYVTDNPDGIELVSIGARESRILVGERVMLANDIEERQYTDIRYGYYVDKIWEIITKITGRISPHAVQPSLGLFF